MTYAPWRTGLNIVICVCFSIFFAGYVHADIAVAPRTDSKYICNKVDTVPLKNEHKAVENPVSSLTVASPAASLNADSIFQMVNDYRASVGLPIFQKDEKLCEIAASRGPETYNEIFVTGQIHAGFYARNLPYWATENMKYGPNEQDVFTWWMNSPIHRKAIDSNDQFSCVHCYGNVCIELFTSYVSK